MMMERMANQALVRYDTLPNKICIIMEISNPLDPEFVIFSFKKEHWLYTMPPNLLKEVRRGAFSTQAALSHALVRK